MAQCERKNIHSTKLKRGFWGLNALSQEMKVYFFGKLHEILPEWWQYIIHVKMTSLLLLLAPQV